MARHNTGITGLLKNKWIMYGIYGAIAYYGYNWWVQYQAQQQMSQAGQGTSIPEPSVSAFPY